MEELYKIFTPVPKTNDTYVTISDIMRKFKVSYETARKKMDCLVAEGKFIETRTMKNGKLILSYRPNTNENS